MEVDVFTLPIRVGKTHERPKLVYGFLTVDSGSEFILGIELLEATEGIDLLFASLPENLASLWLKHKMVSQELKLRSQRLLNVIRPVADQLALSISLVKKLPALNRAKRALMTQFGF